MNSNTDRGLSQEEFPRLPGQAFAEELDLPLEQEMSRDLITYNVDKEVMVMAAKVLFISQEEFMEKQLAYALARSAAVLMPKKVYLEKQDEVPSRNTGWPKAVGKLCGGAPQPDKEQERILAMMDQYSDQAESSDSSDEQQPTPKYLKLEVKLKNCHGVPVPEDSGADGGYVPGVQRVTLVAGDPSQDCPSCLINMHLCKMCGRVRCKQHHLNTLDDGESFLCSICDPTIVGLSGPTLFRVPGEVPALTTVQQVPAEDSLHSLDLVVPALAQEVYKEKMTSIQEVTVAKKIKVVDMDLAIKIKVGFILISFDSESNYCLIHRRWS